MPKGILIILMTAHRVCAPVKFWQNLSGVAFICPGALKKGLVLPIADAWRNSGEAVDLRGRTFFGSCERRVEAYRIPYQIPACDLSHIRKEPDD
jgi:hypothetical protein